MVAELFHWTINGRPACEFMSRPHRSDRNCQSLTRADLEGYVAEYKAEGDPHVAAVVEGPCPTHQMVLKAEAEREAHWKRLDEERRTKPESHLATAGGRYILFKWVGKWINAGYDHGLDCQFGRAEDALEWVARWEREEGRDPERIRGLYWMDVLGKPIACGTLAFLVVEVSYPDWPLKTPEVQDE